jgi:hypothetical protein
MRVIAAVMFVASLEATSFSVIAKQERMLPRSSGTSHVCCCSAVPYLRGQSHRHVTAAALLTHFVSHAPPMYQSICGLKQPLLLHPCTHSHSPCPLTPHHLYTLPPPPQQRPQRSFPARTRKRTPRTLPVPLTLPRPPCCLCQVRCS